MIDPVAQYTLQIAQLQKNLRLSEQELAAARREVEQQRGLIIGLGQAFVPEAFAALASPDPDADDSAPRLQAMASGDIVALIIRAFVDKWSRLSAFAAGLTEDQKKRALQRILATDPTDWANDPALAESQRAVASERAARLEAEQAARDAEERARRVEAAQAASAAELVRLRGEMKTLQERYRVLQQELREAREVSVEIARPAGSLPPAPSSAPSKMAKPGDAAASPAPSHDVTIADRGSGVSQDTRARSRRSGAEREEGPTTDDPLTALVFVLATRGICERPRLGEILHTEFGFGNDGNHFLINDAFEKAEQRGLIGVVKPRTDTGVGRAPQLIRLTAEGQEIARAGLQVEPVPSELDKLLKRHDTPEHVLLILQARDLFLERYPEPVESVELFPAPVQLDGGKRSEPDLVVQLVHGQALLVECERDTPKNEAQRADKWAKYYQATHGEFCIVCPDPKAVSALFSEVTIWHANQHGGRVHLRLTSVQQVRNATEPGYFWSVDRTLGGENGRGK